MTIFPIDGDFNMPQEATDSGASDDLSLHDRLMNKIAPVEDTVNEPVEETAPEEITEVTDEQDNVDVEPEASEGTTEETQEIDSKQDQEALELPELAEYLNVDHEKLTVGESGELMFKTKIDGQEGKATLTDLVKSYQLEGHLNKQNMEVTEQKKALEKQISESQTQLSAKLQQVEDIAKVVYQELVKEYDSVDWNELRSSDPGEYSARQTDFQTRQNHIAQQYQTIQDQRTESLTASDQVSSENLQGQRAKLVEAMGWQDAEKAKKEFTEISTYAINAGFTQDEVSRIPDHRIIVALSKAAKYDALQKEAPRITNKVRRAPKIAKPGTVKSKPSSKDELAALRKDVIANDGKNGSIARLLLKSGRI